MKKVLSRILALAIAVVIFSAPSVAKAASIPVLTLNEGGLTFYEYQPDPYLLKANVSTVLSNIKEADQLWTVPAGKNFVLDLGITNGTFRLVITKSGSGIYYNQLITVGSGGYTLALPASSSESKYEIWVAAYSDVSISFYGAYIGE